MLKDKIFIVHLRQPTNDKNEKRSDPFWEFGSFGLTGCHYHNLLHENNIRKLDGNRLAFAQNGHEGFKLLLLTPPVNVIKNKKGIEVTWDNKQKPFKYTKAPLIVNNNHETEFQLLYDSVLKANRKTDVAKFSSSFRTRCSSLDTEIANEVFQVFSRKYTKADKKDLISKYTEALPYDPPCTDNDRKKTYKDLLESSNKKKSECRRC